VNNNEYLEVTFGDLLSNRAKIQPFEDDGSDEWIGLPNSSTSIISKLDFAKYALKIKSHSILNNEYSYSNGGFIIAAMMMEKRHINYGKN